MDPHNAYIIDVKKMHWVLEQKHKKVALEIPQTKCNFIVHNISNNTLRKISSYFLAQGGVWTQISESESRGLQIEPPLLVLFIKSL